MKGLSIALFVVGVILLIMGIQGTDSVASQISNLFTGAPTEKTIWLVVGGVVCLIVGFFSLFRTKAS